MFITIAIVWTGMFLVAGLIQVLQNLKEDKDAERLLFLLECEEKKFSRSIHRHLHTLEVKEKIIRRRHVDHSNDIA